MYKPITIETHRHQNWCRSKNYAFAADFSSAPIVASEIPRAALTMPLAFVLENDTYRLAAVLSTMPGVNLFVPPNGSWAGGYIPADIRSYPFVLKTDTDDKETLYADESSGLITKDQCEGVPVFDEHNEWSEPVRQVLHFLRQREQNRLVTARVVSVLAAADLLTEWPFKMTIKGDEQTATGFYRIDESRLADLSDTGFLQLRHSGALKVAFAQLLSMGNVAKLANMARMREKMAKKAPEKPFSLGNDEIFRFE